MRKPPVTDAKFVVVEHRLRIRWGALAASLVYIGLWAAVAYTQNDPLLSATCVILAGVLYPVLAFCAQITEKVSGAQVDALRQRMDPRRPWRKRAIADLRR